MANTAGTRAAANRAAARTMAAIALAGGTAEQAIAAVQPINDLIRDAEERERRYQRRKAQERIEVLCQIEDGELDPNLYSPAELYALTYAETTRDVVRLIREWEEWERQATACPYDIWDGSNDYCAA